MKDKVLDYVTNDWASHPVRFLVEVGGMVLNIVAAIILAFQAPEPNLVLVYGFFISASVLLIIAAILRKSTGFLILYLMLFTIDSIGMYNTLMS